MRPRLACFFILLLLVSVLLPVHARGQNANLSPNEVQDLRDNAVHPDVRIKLYIKFINQRLDALRQLAADPRGDGQALKIHNKLDEFTHLCDELQDNIDTYNGQHADIRKPLKELVAETAKWPDVIESIPSSSNYDFTQKMAVESAQSANQQAKQLSAEQDVFFDTHKKMRHTNGTGPQ